MMRGLTAGLKSTNTTIAGGIMILLAVLNAAQDFMEGGVSGVDINIVVTQIIAGIGLIMSRDSGKSSEDVGAYIKK